MCGPSIPFDSTPLVTTHPPTRPPKRRWQASGKFGRSSYDKIAADVGKPEEEVARYASVFWEKGEKELAEVGGCKGWIEGFGCWVGRLWRVLNS